MVDAEREGRGLLGDETTRSVEIGFMSRRYSAASGASGASRSGVVSE